MKLVEDKTLAMLELRRDPLFHKISSEKYDYYIENSIRIGKEHANKYKGKELQQLYRDYDIEISYSDRSNLVMNFQIRAEFIQKEGKNEVVLHRNSLRQLEDSWNASGYFSEKLTYSEIENIHLAHEFHHFLEYNLFSPVDKQLEPVITKSIFGSKKKQYIRQCSEIACHAFAKELTGFNYFPTILDVTFLESKGELDQEIADEIFNYKNE